MIQNSEEVMSKAICPICKSNMQVVLIVQPCTGLEQWKIECFCGYRFDGNLDEPREEVINRFNKEVAKV